MDGRIVWDRITVVCRNGSCVGDVVMEIVRVDEHITGIDADLFGFPGMGMVYVVRGDEVALVETGTSLTVGATLEALDRLGIAREAVGHIVCTHVHMDHAGGAGYLAAALPRARVYVHSASLAHLVDPGRLMASVRRGVGEAIWPLYGDMVPIEAERLAAAEYVRLDLGQGVVLTALQTPGHSPDHVSFWERRSGGLFLGDAALHRMERYGLKMVVTPAPSYDLEVQRATISMLRQQNIGRLYITHYGVHETVGEWLRLAHDILEEMAQVVRDALDAGEDDVEVIGERWMQVAQRRGYVGDDAGGVGVLVRSWSVMNVAGLLRYEKRRRSGIG